MKQRNQNKVWHRCRPAATPTRWECQSITNSKNLANQKILQCRKINKTPILVGGTGLYFKALTEGLVNIPKIPINKK